MKESSKVWNCNRRKTGWMAFSGIPNACPKIPSRKNFLRILSARRAKPAWKPRQNADFGLRVFAVIPSGVRGVEESLRDPFGRSVGDALFGRVILKRTKFAEGSQRPGTA